MTPSTTNTAAREVVTIPREPPSEVISAMQQAHSIYTHGCKMSRAYSAAFEYFATLTQQQGGEQEAGEFDDEAIDHAIDAADEYRANYEGVPSASIRAYRRGLFRAAITAALRTKQPAASEGGGRVELTLDKYAQNSADWNGCHGQAVRALRYLGKHGRCPDGGEQFPNMECCYQIAEELEASFTAIRNAAANTSKQAAGEVVALPEGFSVYAALRSIRYNADNGSQDRPAHERLRLISEEVRKAIACMESDMLDPRHPADEGRAVDDAMIERGAKGAWEMVPRGVLWENAVHCRDEWTAISRAVLTAALQAGTP